jgi:alcohol dehydrogenase
VDPLLSCGECRECRRGCFQHCRYSGLRGYFNMGPDGDRLQRLYPYGGMSEYVTSPATKVARLPDNIDFDTAAHLGYLGTSYAALLKGKLRPRGTLLINGVTGTLGVAAVQMALGLGARRILGVGRKPDVMARIKSLAPDRIDVTSYDPATTVQWVKDRTGGHGADMLYDCLGAGGSADWTSNLLNGIAPDGSCIAVAAGVDGQICRDYLSLLSHPIDIKWSGWFTSAEIDDLIELIGDGTIDVSACETRAFRLEQVNDALALAGSRPGGFVNVTIHPDE